MKYYTDVKEAIYFMCFQVIVLSNILQTQNPVPNKEKINITLAQFQQLISVGQGSNLTLVQPQVRLFKQFVLYHHL